MFFALEPGSWYGRHKGISTAFTQLSAKCRVRPHKGMVIMLPAAGWLGAPKSLGSIRLPSLAGWVGYRSPKADSPGRAGLTDSHLNMNTSCGRHNHWEASIYPVWQAGSGIGPGSEGRGWVQADSSQAGRLGRVDSSQAGWLGWADLPRWAWVRPGGWVGKAAPRAGLGGEAPGERRGKG